MHRDTFKNGNREWKFVPTQLKFRNQKNLEKTDSEKAAKVKGLLQKEVEKRRRLKELGIDFDFPGYAAIVNELKGTVLKTAKEVVVAEQAVKKSKSAPVAVVATKSAKESVPAKSSSSKADKKKK